MARKAAVAEERLLFVIEALRKLRADENFTTLLRAEDLETIPESLAELMNQSSRRERDAA
jgi:ParB family chromosome partitioning protein